jgi:hypothetical protein
MLFHQTSRIGRTFASVEQRLKHIRNRALVFENWSGRLSV